MAGDDTSDPTTATTTSDDSDSTTAIQPEQVVNDALPNPYIAGLLPNPASPQTDEVDEYIELYNPNDAQFNLKGYTLETGSTTLHDFTFTSDPILEPQSYRALYSVETGLSLSNSGGSGAITRQPRGGTEPICPSYITAADGMSWSLDDTDGTWKWITSQTPNSVNLIITPAVTRKAAIVKVATVKKATAKVKGISTVKVKKTTAKKAKVAKVSTTTGSATPGRPEARIHVAALAAVAILRVAYMLYEYRHDLANRIYQFRDNRAASRRARG